MASPFPGIDPFIESQGLWPDFHATFINYMRECLADVLPSAYEVRIDERVNFIQVQDQTVQRIRPDVSVAKVDSESSAPTHSGSVVTLQPVTLPETIEEEVRQAYIEIINRLDRTLVTILEVLSPSNKTQPGREVYQAKRGAIIQQPIHLVELDFLRAGQRHRFARELPPGDYYAMVSRVEQRFNCDVYAWSIQQSLPSIPVPLAAPDPDVTLGLQSVYDLTFERGRYARSIRYDQPLVPALDEKHQNWLNNLLKNQCG